MGHNTENRGGYNNLLYNTNRGNMGDMRAPLRGYVRHSEGVCMTTEDASNAVHSIADIVIRLAAYYVTVVDMLQHCHSLQNDYRVLIFELDEVGDAFGEGQLLCSSFLPKLFQFSGLLPRTERSERWTRKPKSAPVVVKTHDGLEVLWRQTFSDGPVELALHWKTPAHSPRLTRGRPAPF